MRHIKFIFLMLILTACKEAKYPFGQISFKGVVKTCVLDSTSFTNEKAVHVLNAQRFINLDCPNKPVSYDYPMSWPSMLWLDFKTKKYIFAHSEEPVDKNLEFNDKKFRNTYRVDTGIVKFNKKLNTLKFTSEKFRWAREFKIISLNKDSLVLDAINTH